MKIKIKCGKCKKPFVEGEIRLTEKRKKAFDIREKCKGEIWKMNSNDPKDWGGRCSSCHNLK